MENGQLRNAICAICLEVWTRPKKLPCDHIFCEECLEKVCTNGGRWVRCRQCREVHMVPAVGLRNSWQTQPVLANVADKLQNMDLLKPIGPPLQSSRVMSRDSRPKPRPPLPPKPKIADPLQSYVERHNVKPIKIGEEFSIVVQLCDKKGQVMASPSGRDNIKAFVDLVPRPRGFRMEEIKPSLTREGKYSITYQAKRCGIHKVGITLQNEVIKGAPLSIPAVPRGIHGCEIKGPLKGPLDVVEYQGNLLVTDAVSRAIFLVDQAGRELMKLKEVPENMKKNFLPVAIAVYQNKVFVTDMNNKCVHVYENLDAFPRQFGKPHLKTPIGIAVSSQNGDIFIADQSLGQILAFNRNLQFVQALSFHPFPPGGRKRRKRHEALKNPAMVAINRNGDKLYVADQCGEGYNSVKIINLSDNTFEKNIPVRFFYNQAKPFGVTLDEDDNIFASVQVNTENVKLGRIEVFSSDGRNLQDIGRIQNQSIISPFGLCIPSSPAGYPSIIYVVDACWMNLPKSNGSLKGFII